MTAHPETIELTSDEDDDDELSLDTGAKAFALGAGPFPPTSTPPIPSHGPEIPIVT